VTRVRYREGDWVAVPLRTGGYAAGIVARGSDSRVAIGYFFGPRTEQPPSLEDVARLRAREAVFVCQFGDLGIIRGWWPRIGRLEGFDRAAWPMPVFFRDQVLTGRSFRVHYDEDDPSVELGEEPADANDRNRLPLDGMYGYGAVEVVVTKRLGQLP
jgi:hypothetical protein